MAEDFDNHRRIFDGSGDLQGAAAVGAVLHVDVEDPFERTGPAHARRLSLGRGVIGCGLGGTLCRSGNDFTAQFRARCQYAMGISSRRIRRLYNSLHLVLFPRTCACFRF
jgi:hypothetical protein